MVSHTAPDHGLENMEATVSAIVSRTKRRASDLIPILQEIQAEYRYLPESALRIVAEALGVSPATVFGVATFYAQFSLEPKGKWIIKVCDGTACHVRGSQRVLDWLRKKLDLAEGETTSKDGLFSVEVVSCLGACGLAPVIVVGENVHGQVTPEALEGILDHLMQEETDAQKTEVETEVHA